MTDSPAHPLDPLTAEEIRQAAAILRRERGVGAGWRFASIELKEPGKAALAAGKQIQYVGAGGPIVFNHWHNSTGAFEAARYVNGKLVLVGSVSAAQIAAISR